MGGVKPETQLSGNMDDMNSMTSRGVNPPSPINTPTKIIFKALSLNSLWREVFEQSKKKHDKSIISKPVTLPDIKPMPKDEFLCVGVGSKQATGKHILFLDLDGNDVTKAEKVARKLISAYGVSDCYIVQSSPGNHHLICFDMLDFPSVQKIAKQHAHDQWAKFRGDSKDFVLRISPKLKLKSFSGTKRLVPVDDTQPHLVSIVKSPFNNYSKSNSLRRVFQNLWGEKIKKDKHFTDSQKFRFHIYRVRLMPKGKEVETFAP